MAWINAQNFYNVLKLLEKALKHNLLCYSTSIAERDLYELHRNALTQEALI